MLKKFEVTNYKSFKNKTTIDFTKVDDYDFNENLLTNNMISKMMIYGKNGVGKSNLGKALMDIKSSAFGTSTNKIETNILNADSDSYYAEFYYEFVFDGDELIYRYKKDNNNIIVFEELVLNNKVYNDCNCQELSGSKVILNFRDYIRGMKGIIIFNEDKIDVAIRNVSNDIFVNEIYKNNKLEDFEKFLNYMGVECSLKIKEEYDDNKLYFNKNRLIPFFENASKGTLKLFDIYKNVVISEVKPTLIYFDDFDTHYHYDTVRKMFHFFVENYKETQVIFANHNTHLISNQWDRPDCMFVLSKEYGLTSFTNATNRQLKQGHNLEKMYIAGEFERYE